MSYAKRCVTLMVAALQFEHCVAVGHGFWYTVGLMRSCMN